MRRDLVLTTALILLFPALAAAQSAVPLERVASQAGYTYTWSPEGGSVILSRPGIVVDLRAGEHVYQVNNHLEVTREAPRYAHGDLLVSPRLAAHLEALAVRTASRRARPIAALSSNNRSVHGSLSLEARQLQGAEAISVEGQAPAGAPVTITLLAIVSDDVPTIVVSRNDVVTDVNGRFGAVVPIAPAYERGTLFRVVATSSSGVSPASAQIVLGAPNQGVTVPLESSH